MKRFKGDLGRIYAFTRNRPLSHEEKGLLASAVLESAELAITRDDYLRFYPRICAHIISESLGYASPECAANILKDSVDSGVNHCEWVSSCFNANAKAVVRASIRGRHGHSGYMAWNDRALNLVRRAIAGNRTGTELGSWF